jgi:hypothetical protein
MPTASSKCPGTGHTTAFPCRSPVVGLKFTTPSPCLPRRRGSPVFRPLGEVPQWTVNLPFIWADPGPAMRAVRIGTSVNGRSPEATTDGPGRSPRRRDGERNFLGFGPTWRTRPAVAGAIHIGHPVAGSYRPVVRSVDRAIGGAVDPRVGGGARETFHYGGTESLGGTGESREDGRPGIKETGFLGEGGVRRPAPRPATGRGGFAGLGRWARRLRR